MVVKSDKFGVGLVNDTPVNQAEVTEVVTLTKEGHRMLSRGQVVRRDQATYHGLKKPKEAAHDADLCRLYNKVNDEIESRGGRVLRVRLDYKIKDEPYSRIASAAKDVGRKPEAVREEVAERYHLKVVSGKIPIPDIRTECVNENYLVATHSGYFTVRQFLEFAKAKSGKRNARLVEKLFALGHVSAQRYRRRSLVYHLHSRPIYDAIGKGELRIGGDHELGYIKTRLLALDYILAYGARQG